MKKCEVAKFTLEPEWTEGNSSKLPGLPEKESVILEVELLEWTPKEDLFSDEGAVKSQVKEGSGWKSPRSGDEVLLSVKALSTDGAVIEERLNIEYTLGSDALGALQRVCDKALSHMKKGEEVNVKREACRRSHG